MKLFIKEEMWGVNRRTGKGSVRNLGEKAFECVTGGLPPFGNGRRVFSIDEVTENSVTFSVHCVNEKYNRSWTLEKGESVFYRPMSMDGGYQYTFRLE